MIVVVVMLTLMILMGAAYIQIARLDRQAGQETGGNIDAVVEASKAQIQSILAQDLMNNNGAFFAAPADPANPTTTPITGEIATGTLIEPYDYPWTNTNYTVTSTGAAFPVGAKGGSVDDTWLASTAPTTSSGTTKWPHLTNLNGIFLRLPSLGSTLTSPEEDLLSFANAYTQSDTDITLTGTAYALDKQVNNIGGTDNKFDTLGADADKDGIPDSRWTWAPLRQINDIQYVMAVRIIDNSAMINVNTALSQVDNTGNFDGAQTTATSAPRWWFPSELDLGSFVGFLTNGSNTNDMMNELNSLLRYRLGVGAGNFNYTPWPNRNNFWVNGARLYNKFSSPYRSLTSTEVNERELRYRNGLNNSLLTSEIKNQLPTFLRKSATTESSYTNADLALYGGPAAPHTDIQAFFDKEPRKQMTTFSGAAIFAPRLAGEMTSVGRTLKEDINALSGAQLATKIKEMMDAPGTPGPFPLPPGYAATATTDAANQFAANIKTYAQPAIAAGVPGNKLYEVGGRYGLAALPFIGEVYAQARYQVTSAANSVSTPTAWDVTWTRQGNTGYAIEIRNPFRQTISLENVQLWVGGANWGELSTLANNQLTLAPDKCVVIYRHSNSDTPPTDDDKIGDTGGLIDITSGNVTAVVTTANEWPTSGTVSVELRAKGSDDNWLTWGYTRIDNIDSMPVSYPENNIGDGQPDPSSPPVVGYRQRTAIGTGNGINVLSVKPDEYNKLSVGNPAIPAPVAPASLRDSSLDKLGEDNKGIAILHDRLGAATNQIVMSSQGFIAQVGELAHIMILGPRPDPTNPTTSPSHTVAEDFNDTYDLSKFMLDFNDTSRVAASGNLQVTHAALLIDRFTTLSPQTDGLDNDGTGTPKNDNPEEQLIPGTINLNTATQTLLEKVLPITDTNIRKAVVARILNFRANTRIYNDDPADSAVGQILGTPTDVGSYRYTPPTDYRLNPGIAYMGELYVAMNNLLSGTVGKPTINNVVVDFLAPLNAGNYDNDGVSGDIKQKTMIARFLNQVASTRSDFYTAYVLIRGYRINEFNKDPVETARYFVVLDRSAITSKSDSVRIVAYQRLE